MDRETRDTEKYLKRTPKKNNQSYHKILEEKQPMEDKENYEHDVYKDISYINGQINRMNLNQLKNECKNERLDCNGGRDPIKRRLKEHYKVKKLVEAGLLEAKANRNSDYLLVIDFEATCEEKNPAGYPHEIIEFPAILVATSDISNNGKSPEIVDIFHSYVKPVINPKLSGFCKALTGIEQEIVDKAEVFSQVLDRFSSWMTEKHGLGTKKSYVIITDGPFDMGRFMYLQCQHSKIEFPEYLSYWANLRKVFVNFYKSSFYSNFNSYNNRAMKQLPGLHTMLDKLGLEFEGKPHCGLDDAKNIANIVIRLLKDQAVIRVNEKFQTVGKDIDDSDRCSGKLFSVVPVNKKEAGQWNYEMKKRISNYENET